MMPAEVFPIDVYLQGALQILEYLFTTATGSVAPPNDYGMVASIDGRKSRGIRLALLL
jgi:hypothetical protein